MAFAAARMILKDKRRKTSKEDFVPRNRSKVKIYMFSVPFFYFCNNIFHLVVLCLVSFFSWCALFIVVEEFKNS
jgi:hypothetical protein